MFIPNAKMTLNDIKSDFIISHYLHGISREDLNGKIYGAEGQIDRLIQFAIGDAETILGTPLKKTMVKCEPINPSLRFGVDYHKTIKRLPYYPDEAKNFFRLHLPDAQILSIDNVQVYYLNQLVYTFNLEDVRLEWPKEGIIHIIPRILSGVLGAWGQFPGTVGIFHHILGPRFLPDFWAIDYTCGFDGPIPDQVAEWICLKTAIRILPIVGTAEAPGLTSHSLSFDSYSENESLTQSASSHLYSALENSYREQLKDIDLRSKVRSTIRGLKVFSI